MMEAGHKAVRWSVCLIAAIVSGAMIASGYAPWESTTAPWAGLVPLLLICRFRPPGESFKWGLLSGAVTWLTGLFWLNALHQTAELPWLLIVPGWIGISLYCALYTAVFAWVVSKWLLRVGVDHIGRNILSVLLIPVFWTGLEYVRSFMFTGFPWNPLGATQAQNPAISQAAELGGVYLVSAIVVCFNTAIAFTLVRYVNWRDIKPYRPHVELFMGLVLMAVCTVWGRARFQHAATLGGDTLIALVQPAVPQNIKWDDHFAEQVHAKLTNLTGEAMTTSEALAGKGPDLIIWPETSTPDDMSMYAPYRNRIEELAALNGPLLVGTLYEEPGQLFNSSLLIDERGEQRYDKQHLVPFGEFIPLDKYFPALQKLSPLGLSLTAGTVPTVFSMSETGPRFSVTICFEDIFPGLSREFVREGARILINQSNDAWFDGTAQHRQHLNLSVMRCIENRVPGVRVSNSGTSGFIEPNGRVYHTGLARGDEGWLGAPGPLPDGEALSDMSLVAPPPEDMEMTLYTRVGDWSWAIPCLIVLIAGLLADVVAGRMKAQGERT
jgi:apolipoprotein N-acyltransferase